MSAFPGCIVITYSSSCLDAATGRATGIRGTSRWKGSNGPDADARVNALVMPFAARLRWSKSNEHTSAMPPKPRPSAERRVIPSPRSQSITGVPCP
jgi:hypothetical protein